MSNNIGNNMNPNQNIGSGMTVAGTAPGSMMSVPGHQQNIAAAMEVDSGLQSSVMASQPSLPALTSSSSPGLGNLQSVMGSGTTSIVSSSAVTASASQHSSLASALQGNSPNTNTTLNSLSGTSSMGSSSMNTTSMNTSSLGSSSMGTSSMSSSSLGSSSMGTSSMGTSTMGSSSMGTSSMGSSIGPSALGTSSMGSSPIGTSSQSSLGSQLKNTSSAASSGSHDIPPTVILSRPRLQDLVREVDPTEQLDEEVEELLLQLADDFVESTVSAACLLAKHRKATTVEVKDVQLHLERQWNMWLPGFGTDELRPYKRAPVTEAHKQRLALIRKALKKY